MFYYYMVRIKKERVLIKPEDIKPSSELFEVLGTINPAAARLVNGDILLYVRVIEKLKEYEDEKFFYSPRMIGKEKYRLKIDRFLKKDVTDNSKMDFTFKDGTKRLTFISHFRRVVLDKDGFKIKQISDKPDFYGLEWDGELGVEDPRITKINNLYVMTYVSLTRSGNVSTSYAISNNCIKWYRRGMIFGTEDKDVVLFPELVNNQYYAFDRPVGSFNFSLPKIWISSSHDLEGWSKPRPVKLTKRGDWDYGTNGSGPPPIKTDKGWLLIYHVVLEKHRIIKHHTLLSDIKKIFGFDEVHEEVRTTPIYLVGAALFKLNNPRKMIAKSKHPIMVPDKKHEKGTFEKKRVVFPTGIVFDNNQKDLLIYCGGGDVVTSVKKIELNSIMKSLESV